MLRAESHRTPMLLQCGYSGFEALRPWLVKSPLLLVDHPICVRCRNPVNALFSLPRSGWHAVPNAWDETLARLVDKSAPPELLTAPSTSAPCDTEMEPFKWLNANHKDWPNDARSSWPMKMCLCVCVCCCSFFSFSALQWNMETSYSHGRCSHEKPLRTFSNIAT